MIVARGDLHAACLACAPERKMVGVGWVPVSRARAEEEAAYNRWCQGQRSFAGGATPPPQARSPLRDPRSLVSTALPAILDT